MSNICERCGQLEDEFGLEAEEAMCFPGKYYHAGCEIEAVDELDWTEMVGFPPPVGFNADEPLSSGRVSTGQ